MGFPAPPALSFEEFKKKKQELKDKNLPLTLNNIDSKLIDWKNRKSIFHWIMYIWQKLWNYLII